MKLSALIEAISPKQVIELQSELLDGLYGDDWGVELADKGLTVSNGKDTVSYNYEYRIVKTTAFELPYEVDFMDHPSQVIMSYVGITDAFRRFKDLDHGYKFKFDIDDSDSSLLMIAFTGKNPITFDVRIEVMFDGEWMVDYQSDLASDNASFDKLDDLVKWARGMNAT